MRVVAVVLLVFVGLALKNCKPVDPAATDREYRDLQRQQRQADVERARERWYGR